MTSLIYHGHLPRSPLLCHCRIAATSRRDPSLQFLPHSGCFVVIPTKSGETILLHHSVRACGLSSSRYHFKGLSMIYSRMRSRSSPSRMIWSWNLDCHTGVRGVCRISLIRFVAADLNPAMSELSERDRLCRDTRPCVPTVDFCPSVGVSFMTTIPCK